MKWIKVTDRAQLACDGNFLAYWNLHNTPLMLNCFLNSRGNYIIAWSNGDVCGDRNNPKFSHWMPLPEPPKEGK